MESNRQPLRYGKVVYPNYEITADGDLYLRLKSGRLRRVNPHPRGDGYLGFLVKHPTEGTRKWIMAHRATQELFCGPSRRESSLATTKP